MQKHETKQNKNAQGDEGEMPPRLQRFLTKQVRNREDASDLAQEAFLRYFQLPDRQRVERRDAYIFQIALNLLSEWRHHRDRAKRVSAEMAELGQWAEGGASVVDTVEVIEDERLHQILEAIPEQYRRVLWAIKVEEKNYLQVAAEMGLKPKTVLVYLSRAVLAARQFERDGC